jgi:hypothetical protein
VEHEIDVACHALDKNPSDARLANSAIGNVMDSLVHATATTFVFPNSWALTLATTGGEAQAACRRGSMGVDQHLCQGPADLRRGMHHMAIGIGAGIDGLNVDGTQRIALPKDTVEIMARAAGDYEADRSQRFNSTGLNGPFHRIGKNRLSKTVG